MWDEAPPYSMHLVHAKGEFNIGRIKGPQMGMARWLTEALRRSVPEARTMYQSRSSLPELRALTKNREIPLPTTWHLEVPC